LKFNIKAYIFFTSPPEKEDIEKAIEEIYKKISSRKNGEETKIIEMKFLNEKIFLNIVSGKKYRAHSFLLMIRNKIAKELEKKKIGIREIKIEKAEAWIEIKQKPLEEINMPFVEKIDFNENIAHIVFSKIDEKALERNYIDRIVQLLEKKILAQYITGKAVLSKTIKESPKRLDKYSFKKDFTEELIKIGWIKEFPARGIWQYMPPYTALIRAIEAAFIENIVKQMGFKEMLFPKLIPLEVHMRKGQLTGIPNEMFWVCPPKSREKKIFEYFSDYVEITREIPKEELMKCLDTPIAALSYAQCEPWYEIFRGEIIDIDNGPWLFFDRFGPTWRYEAGGLKGIERLTEFYRMELTWIGKPEDVTRIRDELLNRAEKFVDNIMDIEYRIEATTPVYLEHSLELEEEKKEIVKTYEIVGVLPYGTLSRPEEKELELSNFSVHLDFYAKRYNWKERKNRDIWSGCSGIGLSRYAYMFIARWGINFEDWPYEIKKYIGEKLPETIFMITWPKQKDSEN
jgi:seryl-tRNA synthetase